MKGEILVYRIVNMEAKHLEQVHDIEKECFSIPWSKKQLEREITENNLAYYIVALDGEEVVGYGGMWLIVTEGHITNIAVKEKYRRKGIGDIILKDLISFAEKKQFMGITLEVRISNLTAQKLYTKNGFKIEGFRKDYYRDTHEDAIIMWKYF